MKKQRNFLACIFVTLAVSVAAQEPHFSVDALTFKDSFNTYFWGTEEVYKIKPVPDIVLGTTAILLNVAALGINATTDHVAGTNTLYTDNINAFDRWSANPYNKGLDITSTVFEVTLALTPALLLLAPKEDWSTIGVMYAESFLLAFGAKEMAKALIPRSRPYNYFDGAPQKALDNGDFAQSFFSGHTTIAFNGAVFVSTVFWAYFPDSIWRIPVLAGTLSFATATGIMRIASGNHFFSDVLVGALVGGATGFLVPFLHSVTGFPFAPTEEREEETLSLNVLPGAVSATYWF
jgi:undecaprenyl-diphosphatase